MKFKYEPLEPCTCEVCQGYCKSRPGWFLPDEAEKVADFLRIPVRELYENYLVTDYWVGGMEDGDDIYVLSPGSEKEHGRIASFFDFAFSQCIFFENGRCKIHPVKPFECRVMNHDNHHLRGLHGWVATQWTGHQDEIGRISGKERIK